LFDDILINNKINPTALTNNPIKIKKNITGVFNYQYVTLKMFKEFNELTEKVKKDAQKFAYPLLMCLGSMDFIQPPEEAENFVENTSTKDREVAIFENGYHQLYNDVKA
jgi:esterase/lipase